MVCTQCSLRTFIRSMETSDYSVFADCYTSTIVVRAPYKVVIDLIKNMDESEEKEELLGWLGIALRRSAKMTKYFVTGQENP